MKVTKQEAEIRRIRQLLKEIVDRDIPTKEKWGYSKRLFDRLIQIENAQSKIHEI